MLDYLLAADLLLLTVGHAVLVHHCMGARKAAPSVLSRVDGLSEAVTEAVAILTDMADLMEDSGPTPAAAGPPAGGGGSPVGALLTHALMARMGMGSEHGEEANPLGAILQGQDTTEAESQAI